jgi:flagellar FliL protein
MTLKVRDEKTKAQIVEFMPELRSRALMLLSNRSPTRWCRPRTSPSWPNEIRCRR